MSVNVVLNVSTMFRISHQNMLDTDEIDQSKSEEYSRRLRILDGLRSALRTQPLTFVERFIQIEGLSHLLHFLSSMSSDMNESRIHTSAIGCVKGNIRLHNSIPSLTM